VALKYGKQIRINEAILYAEVAGLYAARCDYICPRFGSWILPIGSHSPDQFQNEKRENGYSDSKMYIWGEEKYVDNETKKRMTKVETQA